MRSRMWPKETSKIWLEGGKVPSKRFDRVIHIRFRERGVDKDVGRKESIDGESGQSTDEGLNGIITADVVRDGVSKFDVLETTCVDLEIVVRVAPATETFLGVVGKDGGMVEVRGVCFGVRTGIRCS